MPTAGQIWQIVQEGTNLSLLGDNHSGGAGLLGAALFDVWRESIWRVRLF